MVLPGNTCPETVLLVIVRSLLDIERILPLRVDTLSACPTLKPHCSLTVGA